MTSAAPSGFAPSAPQPPAPQYFPGLIPIDELKIEKVAFRDLGNRLPVGLVINGECHREVTFKPYNPETQMAIGRLLKSADGNPKETIDAITKSLVKLVDRIGTWSLDELAAQFYSRKPEWAIEALEARDVITMSFLARLHMAMPRQEHDYEGHNGYDVSIAVACEKKSCDQIIKQIIDLSEMEIGVVKNPLTAPLLIAVPLSRPLTFMAGTEHQEQATFVQFKPPTWRDLKDQQKQNSPEEDRAAQILMMGSLPEASSVPFDAHTWRQVISNPKNAKVLYEASDKLNEIGPKVAIPIVCGCPEKNKQYTMVPWMALSTFLFDPAD